MASPGGTSSQPPSGATTPRSKLDSVSREQLLLLLKKQQASSKKLQERVAQLEAEAAVAPPAEADEDLLRAKDAELDGLRARLAEDAARRGDEAEQLRASAAASDAVVERLSSELEEARALSKAELEAAADSRRELDEKLSHESRELSAAKRELREVRELSEQMLAQKAALEAKVDAQLEYQSLKAECDALSAALDERAKEITDREAAVAVVSSNLATRVSELEDALKAAEAKTAVPENLREELHELRATSTQRARMCEELQTENGGLVEELESLRERMGSERKILEAAEVESERLRESVAAVEARLAAAAEEWEQSAEELRYEKELAKSRLADRISALEEENRALKSGDGWGEEVEKEDDGKEARIAELETELDGLKAAAAKARLSSEQRKLSADAQLAAENERLKTAVGEAEEGLRSLAEQKAALEERGGKLEASLERLRAELEEAKREDGESLRLQERVDELVEELAVKGEGAAAEAELRAELEDVSQQLRGARSSWEAKNEECMRMTAQLESQETIQLLAKISELEAQAVEKTKETENLETQKCKAEERGTELEKRLEALAPELTAAKALCDTLQKDVDQMDELKEQMRKAKADYIEVEQQLEAYKEKASSSSVLGLEMADYERSLSKATEEIADLKQLIDSKTRESQSQAKEMECVREQKAKMEETAKKLKAALLKTRAELAQSKEAAEEAAANLVAAEARALAASEEMDGMKVELSSSLAGRESRLSGLESMVGSLQRQLDAAVAAREDAELQLGEQRSAQAAYKSRVESVLKAQQGRGGGEAEWAEEKERLEAAATALEARLSETKDLLRTSTEELAATAEESERLAARSKELQSQAEAKERGLRSQLESARAEVGSQAARSEELVSRLQRQGETAAATARDKSDELEGRNNLLQSRVEALEAELGSLKTADKSGSPFGDESEGERPDPSLRRPPIGLENPEPPLSATNRHSRGLRTPPPQLSLHYKSRESGDSFPPLTSPPPFTPLEELLQSDQMSVSSMSMVGSEVADVTGMTAQLEAAWRRVRNVTEVLGESEATNAKMTEQVKLLKEEIRRLERNREREAHAQNSEYLKNVVLKFLNPRVGDERLQLIPVLQTMLRLSADETAAVTAVAKGGDAEADTPNSSGWSNYLHRWSGIT